MVQKAFNVLSLFFFIPLVFIGAFFLLNLTLVVIKSKFTEEHEANKERKKHRKFILKKVTKEDIKRMAEAKEAFRRIKIKNKKIREAKLQRRDSDNSKAESRHRRNMEKLNVDDSFTKGADPIITQRVQTAKGVTQGGKTIRPIQGITGFKNTKNKQKTSIVGDPITEEMSNSELSLVNHGNIFYPSNLSANGANDSTHGGGKERNVLYFKNRKGKLKMEGMYGISRMHDNYGADLGSNSDLLDNIGADNEDDEVDMGDNSAPVVPDDEILFPLDDSLSQTSKTRKISNDKKVKVIDNAKINQEKEEFLISESSYDFNDDSKLSPEKNKNIDRKNTNYFTATNLSSIDPNDFKNGGKRNINSTIRKNSKGDDIDPLYIGKTTRISSKIEGGSAFDKSKGMNPLFNFIDNKSKTSKEESPIGKLKEFNISNILFAAFKNRQDTLKKDDTKSLTQGEGEDLTEEHKQDKKETEIKEEDLDQMEAEDIKVVKKGMKIRIKRALKPDEMRETLQEDILIKKQEVESPRVDLHKKDEEEIIKKTTLPPHSLTREMELNEILLEGKVDQEDEEKEETKKVEESKNFDATVKSQDEEPVDEKVNQYLEKFKYFYRANLIATGTVSLVVTLKNTQNVLDIPNPCAESYGAIIIDDDDSSVNEESKSNENPKSMIRRNDTLLPGLMRQNTNTSKGLVRRGRTTKKFLLNKNTFKRRARDEEEYSEENVLKRLIMDIPEESLFFRKEDTLKFKKEMEEDDKLDEGEDENEEEDLYEESEEIEDNMDDIFLDRDIDFDTEIDRACKAAAKRMNDKTEWSGQDIKIDYDPYYARIAVGQMSDTMVYPYGIYGVLSKLRGYIRTFVRSSFFENFMTIAVAINTIVLALDRHGISASQESTLTTMNFYFTIIFICEMGFKLIGLGPITYLKDKMNYLDGMVVLLSIFELAFLSGGGALSAFRAVRIMRTFRVLRVARLLKSMQSMQTIMDVISRSISSFLYLALLLLLFIFIYALLGMQTFGGKFFFDDGVPRSNFDTFNSAFITVFQVMTMENWQVILYDCMRSKVNKMITVLYLISWIFLGNFMLLNLFLAILLDSFAEEDEAEIQKKKSPEELKQDAIEARNDFMRRTGENLIMDYSDVAMSNNKGGKSKGGFVKQTKKKLKNDKLMDESFELEDVALKKKKTVVKEKKPEYWGIECERSLFLLKKNNFIRRIFYKMTNHYLFENVVLILIIFSSLKLAYDTYIIDADATDIRKIVSENIDLFFTFFFLFEAIAKCISQGFIQDKGSYLRESWNQLDFFIVCASIFDMAFDGVDIPAIRILRLLRTLRPLRFISHNSDMKLIVTALLESVGHIINVVVVVLMVWLMFAILAVNLFGGKLYYCTIDTYNISNETDCRLANGKWGPYKTNFDSVPAAMLTLFIISTLENWPDYMYRVVDGAGIETGPKENASPISAYFFVIFIFIGSFFFLNFFVGVIFLNYEEAQKAEKESWFMSKKELEWVDIMKMIVKAKPDLETTNVPKNRFLRSVHTIVTSTIFDIFIMVCIILNMVQMGMTYEDESITYTNALLYINLIFTSVFFIEMCLKLIAFGGTYFKSSWNIFDFIVVMGSLLDIVLTNMNASQLTFLRVGPQLVRVLRVMRVSRLLRLINKYPGLQALIKTIMFSMPSLLSVFSLLLLIFFIFAILGVFIFHNVKSGNVIDDYVNFNNFGNAMIMCLRVSTGEDWPSIMFDTMNTESDCIPGKNCGTSIAPLYFISFIVICSFIMLNLFILVIIQQFDQYYLAEDNIITKFEKDLQVFKNSWTEFTKANH